MTPTQNIGEGSGAVGSVTEGYSKGIVTVQAQLAVPANKYGITGTFPVSLSINLATALSTIAADTGNATVEEVAAFIATALGAL